MTNTSVNPARSTGPAIFAALSRTHAGGWALSQLWLFWVAPILGAILGAFISDTLFRTPQQPIRDALAKEDR